MFPQIKDYKLNYIKYIIIFCSQNIDIEYKY